MLEARLPTSEQHEVFSFLPPAPPPMLPLATVAAGGGGLVVSPANMLDVASPPELGIFSSDSAGGEV
eukprot:scaffold73624_cov62-Phaeocystis_antarctica.AAC.2